MKPETTEDILELLNGYIASAALGAAMELGVFWLLAEKPLSAPDVAQMLLDLGGGSGVVSFALLRKRHELTSVVVDVESVCQAGREIASENRLEERIAYVAADILLDDLPTGFDMVMLCDVGLFSEILFHRIHAVLNQQGRLVIVDKFAPGKTIAPPSRLASAFLTSLAYPAQSVDFPTIEVVQARLQQAGFRDFSVTSVPHKDNLPWNIDWIMLEAHK